MSLKVVVLEGAEQDIKELRAYVTKQFGKPTWQASYGKIKEAIGQIAAYPQSGSVPDELERLGLSGYRQVIAGMNRVIYEVQGETLFIHVICDTRKDMRSLLTRRLFKAS